MYVWAFGSAVEAVEVAVGAFGYVVYVCVCMFEGVVWADVGTFDYKVGSSEGGVGVFDGLYVFDSPSLNHLLW